MLSMPPASSWSRFLRPLGLIAALAAAVVPSIARADTGDPSSPGYTGDVDPVHNGGLAPQTPGAQEPAQDPAQQGAADEWQDNDPSALTDFRDTLDPHGTWVQDPTYGTLWVPNSAEVGSDFAPYQTSGHWAVADSGDWMWASDYDWGYVPFHYGRWVWAGAYWGWIPGRTYAPAWVTWRVGDGGYIGWAPLPPTWYWANGLAVGLWSVPYAAYCFVPTSAVFYNHVSTYVVRDRSVVQSAASSTRPYHPASPSVGSKSVGTHSPQHHMARSPSFAAAHVPASSIPRQRTAHDVRAKAFASRSSSAAVRQGGAWASRPAPTAVRPAPQGNAWQRSYDGFGRSRVSGSHTLGQPTNVHSATPGFRSAAPSPGYARPAPSFHSAAPAQRAMPSRAPSFNPSPSFRSSPSFHPTPSFRSSAPAVHAPSVSRPSTNVSRSAPRFSGGGSRGGGGGRRR